MERQANQVIQDNDRTDRSTDPEEPYDQDEPRNGILNSMAHLTLQEFTERMQDMWEIQDDQHNIRMSQTSTVSSTDKSIIKTRAHIEYLDVMAQLC